MAEIAAQITPVMMVTTAAARLATVMAGGMNADEVSKALGLKEHEAPLYLMALGYPKGN